MLIFQTYLPSELKQNMSLMNTCMYYDEDHIVSIKFTGANCIKDYKLIQIIDHNRFYGKREELRWC